MSNDRLLPPLDKHTEGRRIGALEQILKRTHKGHIPDFILANMDSFCSLITHERFRKDEHLFNLLLEHTQHRITDFVNRFGDTFQSMVTTGQYSHLFLTKKLCGLLNPVTGQTAKNKTPLPDFLENSRSSEILKLSSTLLIEINKSNVSFKRIAEILQDIRLLGIASTDPVDRLKAHIKMPTKTQSPNFDLVLYRCKDPNSTLPHAYILVRRDTSVHSPTEGGIIKVILAARDLNHVLIAFKTLDYPETAYIALKSMVYQFGYIEPSPYAVRGDFYSVCCNLQTGLPNLQRQFLVTQPQGSPQLTSEPNSLTYPHDLSTHPNDRPVLSLQ